jgi:hypothetical protein
LDLATATRVTSALTRNERGRNKKPWNDFVPGQVRSTGAFMDIVVELHRRRRFLPAFALATAGS